MMAIAQSRGYVGIQQPAADSDYVRVSDSRLKELNSITNLRFRGLYRFQLWNSTWESVLQRFWVCTINPVSYSHGPDTWLIDEQLPCRYQGRSRPLHLSANTTRSWVELNTGWNSYWDYELVWPIMCSLWFACVDFLHPLWSAKDAWIVEEEG